MDDSRLEFMEKDLSPKDLDIPPLPEMPKKDPTDRTIKAQTQQTG